MENNQNNKLRRILFLCFLTIGILSVLIYIFYEPRTVKRYIENASKHTEEEITSAMRTIEDIVESDKDNHYLVSITYNGEHNENVRKEQMILISCYVQKLGLKKIVYKEYEWHLQQDIETGEWRLVNQGYL